LAINEKRIQSGKRSNNIKRILKIIDKLNYDGFYGFETFFAYHDTLFNRNLYHEWIDKSTFSGSSNKFNNLSQNEMQNELHNQPSFPKNLILYGPPGTGKTYSSKDSANEILGKEPTIGVNCFFITFHQSYSYEQFIEGLNVRTENNQAVYNIRDGIFKKAANTAKLNKDENIVLIIDEINRGNISKIFGELITLIEDDKRLGEENEIIVTLPYSGEQFGVPPNLYIIGTMNTADRSLVQLDTALRRRFDFEEMMPKYADKILWVNNGILKYTFEEKDFELNLSNFLQKLNERICKEYDREHQIGHSYLMKVKDLKELQRAWENKIMPLLQEYFYSSLESLENIIGTSDYLNKENDTWVLNMKVENDDFANEFTKIYKKLIPSLEQDDSNKN
jgi:5-methylcytosine-specific restriction protein B